jgi:hypothetical protein
VDTPRRRSNPLFIDDRGKPLNLAPDFVMIGQIWQRSPTAVRLRQWGFFALLAAVLTYPIANYLAYGIPPQPVTLGGIVVPALVCGVSIAFGVMRRRKQRAGPSTLAAYLAAHRICGACGYDLHAIAPAGDGRVVCPECGAAWHRDRFVLADRDPTTSALLDSLVTAGHAFAKKDRDDDRGVPMLRPWSWPPGWLNNFPDMKGRAEVAHRDAAHRRRLRGLGVPITLVGWGVGLALFLMIKNDIEAGDILAFFIVSLLIAAVAYWAIFERVLLERAMRREFAELGLCLSCGSVLPEASHPTFDGCTVCASCKRAWKRARPT